MTSAPLHLDAGLQAFRRSRRGRVAALLRRVLGRAERRGNLEGLSVAGVLDLFEEHLYVGEITAEGRYVSVTASPMVERMFGGQSRPASSRGALWESLIHADDCDELHALQPAAAARATTPTPAIA